MIIEYLDPILYKIAHLNSSDYLKSRALGGPSPWVMKYETHEWCKEHLRNKVGMDTKVAPTGELYVFLEFYDLAQATLFKMRWLTE